ncbi:class I SAM-dependent methyltransferase [Rhodocytophaga rosea]|uniref:Class I SAM-dependent methyltransferase n=1 Tax=Rhodocytophaga rosea TaxID=2704465 RepID=A0A6C0GJC9_9BACT|nr:methyltransferase domain-containing protein [Rhodocytophaga rosea]QHT68047.1 class I SAM-dependent methyltransferase [Rhodocytophaga rosea]
MQLQGEQSLIWSTVVANCRMNRERGLLGVNSYEKELKLNILSFLEQKAEQKEIIYWLDICCGTGKALVEAAASLQSKGITNVKIEGWDVAGVFMNGHTSFSNLQFVTDTITNWQPTYHYDLITCVHGLHYIGDKLEVIQRCISYLTKDGLFIGNLDLKNIKKLDGTNLERQLRKTLQNCKIQYNLRHHLLTCEGKKQLKFDLQYVGADDQAGKNYTGQEVVDSYYQ